MWIAFDTVKLLRCRTIAPDEVIANFATAKNALARACEDGIHPQKVRAFDVDEATKAVRETFENCLLAGPDESTVRAALEKMYGADWAYGTRFLVVEKPAAEWFGCDWVYDGEKVRATRVG